MPETADSAHLPPRISLRTRLTLWVMAIFVLIQIVIGAGFWFYQEHTTREVFRERLLERTTAMASDVRRLLPGITADELEAIALKQSSYINFERIHADVLDERGVSVINGAPSWPATATIVMEEALASGGPVRRALSIEDTEFDLGDGDGAELVALPIRSEGGDRFVLLAASSDAIVDRQLALVARLIVTASAVGLIASGLSGWLIAGMAVDPIRRLSGMVHQFTPETIDRELIVDSRESEVTELAAELNSARARMREAFAAQERFLSNISHELKTPIATILTTAQTIDRSTLGKQGLDFVETTEEEMRKLGKLVESFLTLTRIRDGKIEAKKTDYLANELVMDAIEDCAEMASQYGVRLFPSLLVTDAGLDATVVGDPSLLRTMLNNLIRNAIRFSPRHGRVTVAASLDGESLRVTVCDDGPGIPGELLGHLFDRFVQSRSELSRERGHGLGLAIAKGIAELHGGDIAASNRNEGGAQFIVSLRLAHARAQHKVTA